MSDFSGYYKKSLGERVAIVAKKAQLTPEEVALLEKYAALDFETANRMIENVFSTTQMPLAVVPNFVINGKEYVIPFAIEEASVVAAASNAAKLSSGFTADADEPVMIGQIQIVKSKAPEEGVKKILAAKAKLLETANARDSMLVSLGGGAKDVEARVIETPVGKMVIVHLLVNVKDAMGANAVNTMCEAIAPEVAKLAQGTQRLRIISNLAVHRKARARAVWRASALEESLGGQFKGADIVDGIIEAWAFAAGDPYRACTHNKGIMNGIDAVAIATGQDFRALEAGAHGFAAIGGYKPLTRYSKNKDGDLVGEIELPLAVGLVGGATKIHPIAKIAVKMLAVKSAQELSQVFACVGLAQNFAALRALSTEGIQKGHMGLHARNLAIQAGAVGAAADAVAAQMVREGKVSFARAKELSEKK